MLFSLLIPFLIGTCAVLQSGLNKKFAETMGLGSAILVNNIVILCVSAVAITITRLVPESALPELFRARSDWSWQWKLLIPGSLAFVIITMAPWAISRAGATRVFIGIIAAQIVVSLLWDYWAEALPVSPSRMLGALLALAGALLAVR